MLRPDALPMWVEEALTIAQSDALFADQIDWDEVRSQVGPHAERAMAAGVPERALAPLFRALNDNHSFILRDAPSEDDPVDEATVIAPPTAETLPSGIGVLQLPVMPDANADSSCSYQQLGLESIATLEGVDRLIVDLRGNGGGNCYPMLAVLAPILGAGPLVGWEPRTGATVYVEYDGHELTGHRWQTSPPWAKRPERIAVLADADTASSGEAALLALRGRRGCRTFGTATAGLTTANEAYELSDGFTMYLAVARMVASTGEVFDGPIVPEVPTEPSAAFDAALTWLS